MSTIAQMKTVAAPILARNPDLVLIKRFLFLKPVHHVIRFIILDGTSGTTDFRPRIGAFIAFDKADRININYAPHMRHPRRGSIWPVIEATDEDCLFADALEADALPMLRSITDIAEFISFTEQKLKPSDSVRQNGLHMVMVNAALGKFDYARAYCERLASGKAHECMPGFERLVAPVINELWPALKTENPKKIAAVLHNWEEYTVKANHLEKYWEPTPFPFEQM